MATIKVHGGDFVAGESGSFKFGVLSLPTPGGSFLGLSLTETEKIPLSKVLRVEAVNKEMRHRTGAAVGRGLVGALILGPAGAIVGFATTNHKSDVTFEAEFEGGRKLLGTTDTATYTRLLAAAFDYKPPQERGAPLPAPHHGLGSDLGDEPSRSSSRVGQVADDGWELKADQAIARHVQEATQRNRTTEPTPPSTPSVGFGKRRLSER